MRFCMVSRITMADLSFWVAQVGTCAYAGYLTTLRRDSFHKVTVFANLLTPILSHLPSATPSGIINKRHRTGPFLAFREIILVKKGFGRVEGGMSRITRLVIPICTCFPPPKPLTPLLFRLYFRPSFNPQLFIF